MSRDTVKKKVLIDPLFQPPPGSEENFTQKNPPPARMPQVTGPGVTGIEGGVEQNPDTPENPFFLEAPDVIYIVDPTLRRAPGGQQVVDVVIECEEIIGALEYEVQIAGNTD